MGDSVRVTTVFKKNCAGLIEHDAIIELFNLSVETANHQGGLSSSPEYPAMGCRLASMAAATLSFMVSAGDETGRIAPSARVEALISVGQRRFAVLIRSSPKA